MFQDGEPGTSAQSNQNNSLEDEEDNVSSKGSTGSGSEKFIADNDEVDDEMMLIAKEKLGREVSTEEKITMLQHENEVLIKELCAMYAWIKSEVAQYGEPDVSALSNQSLKANEEASLSDDGSTLDLDLDLKSLLLTNMRLMTKQCLWLKKGR